MLSAHDKQFKALGVCFVARYTLCKGGYLHRVPGDEGGLYELFLAIFFKEKVEYVALFVTLLIGYAVRLCRSARRFKVCKGVKIHPGILFNGILHAQTLKGLVKINSYAAVGDLRRAQHIFCNRAYKLLGKIHHAVKVGICLIQLQKREFRVVPCVHALVAEHAAYFVYPFKAAHYQTL